MRKIIGGKVYNTGTAQDIAHWGNGLSTRDFEFCSETLYRTKRGAWFVHGKGGACSRYSEREGNCSYGGQDIMPLCAHEAGNWLHDHQEIDLMTEHFPERVSEA